MSVYLHFFLSAQIDIWCKRKRSFAVSLSIDAEMEGMMIVEYGHCYGSQIAIQQYSSDTSLDREWESSPTFEWGVLFLPWHGMHAFSSGWGRFQWGIACLSCQHDTLSSHDQLEGDLDIEYFTWRIADSTGLKLDLLSRSCWRIAWGTPKCTATSSKIMANSNEMMSKEMKKTREQKRKKEEKLKKGRSLEEN